MEDGKARITNLQPDTVFSPGARPEPGYRVEFVTPSGVRSFVQVPRGDALPEQVRVAVQRECDLIEQTLHEHGYQAPTRHGR